MENYCGNKQYFENENRYNPMFLKNMEKALERIVKAVNNREKIVVYGYYDLDGIAATSLLLLVLRYLNADVEYFIPDEMKEDRKLSCDSIENYIQLLGANLIITVGCGINSFFEVEFCKKLDIDVIITDFNSCTEELPNTIVVSPNQTECFYSFKDLSAAGVAYKLVQAIARYYKIKGINKYIDLVMIGTAASNKPIMEENKIIIEQGVKHLNSTNNYGLKALLKIHKITEINVDNIINFARKIIPPLNTLGPVNDARIAVELFTTSNMDRAEQIAKYLNKEFIFRRSVNFI